MVCPCSAIRPGRTPQRVFREDQPIARLPVSVRRELGGTSVHRKRLRAPPVPRGQRRRGWRRSPAPAVDLSPGLRRSWSCRLWNQPIDRQSTICSPLLLHLSVFEIARITRPSVLFTSPPAPSPQTGEGEPGYICLPFPHDVCGPPLAWGNGWG